MTPSLDLEALRQQARDAQELSRRIPAGESPVEWLGRFPNLTDDLASSVLVLADEVERQRLALRAIAFWEGPGNNRNRVEACKALEIQPWDVVDADETGRQT